MIDTLRLIWKRITFGIHRKIFFLNVLTCVLLSLAISVTVFQLSGKFMREQIYYNMEGFTQQLSNGVDNYIFEMTNTALQISKDPNVISYLYDDYASNVERVLSQIDLTNYINRLNSLQKYSDIYLVSVGGDIVATSDKFLPVVKELGGNEWFRRFTNDRKSVIKIGRFARESISDAYAVIGKTGSSGGYVIITQRTSIYDDLLKNIDLKSPLDAIIIYDQSNNVIYTSNESQKDILSLSGEALQGYIEKAQNFKPVDIERKSYILSVNHPKNADWSVVSFTSERKVTEKLRQLNLYIFIVTVLVITVVFILSYVLSLRLSLPLRKLSRLMRIAEQQNYRLHLEAKSNDEVGELAGSFNMMIQEFVNNQILRREAEMRSLKLQINPHFLYNTLGLINAYANLRGVQEISTICENMSDIFRYTVGEEFTATVETELDYIGKYIGIHQMHQGERLRVVWDIDPLTLTCEVDKFILQPLVENALTHGIQDMITGGEILIRVWSETESVCFEIADNGKGMHPRTLQAVTAWMECSTLSSNSTRNIGLKNVHLRLVWRYGPESGLRILSSENLGTRIRFCIPMVRNGPHV